MSGSPVRVRSALAALAAAALAACSSLAPVAPVAGDARYGGRLAVRAEADGDLHPARAFAATFDLQGNAARGSLSLASPLGAIVGQARWNRGDVLLQTPSETRRYPDLASLTQDVLGDSVPVEALFDWLRGEPWPGAPSEATDGDGGGFTQAGWQVRIEREAAGGRVASVLAVRRAPPPVVTVRVRLD